MLSLIVDSFINKFNKEVIIMKKTISFKGTPVTIEDKLNVGEVFPNFRAVTKHYQNLN